MEVKTKHLHIRLSAIEKEMVVRLAQAGNMTVSKLIRRFISCEVDKHQNLLDSAKEN